MPRIYEKKNRKCSLDGCEKPHLAGGLCSPHYQRKKQKGDVLKNVPCRMSNSGLECEAENCTKEAAIKGYCQNHYQIRRRRGDANYPVISRPGLGWQEINGYRYIKVGRKNVAEHRLVMEAMVGRQLLPNEEVHHKNGVRNDNRPHNLELWATRQPSGQRPTDLAQYAIEILEQYGNEEQVINLLERIRARK